MFPEDLISTIPFYIMIVGFAMIMNEIGRKREEK